MRRQPKDAERMFLLFFLPQFQLCSLNDGLSLSGDASEQSGLMRKF